MTSPLVSAVIPFYGDPTDTLALIEQLQRQRDSVEMEIIVSDDCSPQPFPEIEGVVVVRRESNGGFGANVNSGVAAATGKWLFILNSDLNLGKSFVKEAVAQAEKFGYALFSPQILGQNGNTQWVGRKFPTTFQFAWEWFTPVARFRETTWWHKLVGHDLKCVTGATVETDWVFGACMVMPLTLFYQVGGMDERYFMNSEEVDFQYCMKRMGLPRYFAGSIAVEHVGGGSSGDSQRRRQWVVDSRFIYSRKWGRPKNIKLALTAVSLVNFAFNKVRSLGNPNVHAENILKTELGYLKGK
ncbi:glycosyltransferase family 2 protein [Rothia sp. ZJ1223]|uniref:glycosyltransferase family 2 protein n=1 Tax=Rothia sp. ZJ1223 TaxID=2811098 RepID=UPI001957125E|nr:glycosyltransferase family 2 protein [Rothia sp. ZJ1223]MBM7051413.1 glycosyltransferase family 2 protein [Rothia sp. ZJ1223]